MIILKVIHIVYINSSFLFVAEYILLYGYTTIVVSFYLLVDIWLIPSFGYHK